MSKWGIYKIDLILTTADTSSESGVAVNTYYVHNDHLNTPQILTDDTQQAIWQVESQTPFGELEINEDPDGDGRDIVFNVRFPGQYYDSESHTSYNYFRTYDQSLGRYIQSDPIGLDGGINTYSYAYQNPLSYADPTGEVPFLLAAPAVGEAVVGAVTTLIAGYGMSGLVGGKNNEALQRQIEMEANRREYKGRCGETPPPGLNQCERAKWNLQKAKDCRDLRRANTNRWWGGVDTKHSKQLAQDLDNAVRNAEKAVKHSCKNECS